MTGDLIHRHLLRDSLDQRPGFNRRTGPDRIPKGNFIASQPEQPVSNIRHSLGGNASFIRAAQNTGNIAPYFKTRIQCLPTDIREAINRVRDGAINVAL